MYYIYNIIYRKLKFKIKIKCLSGSGPSRMGISKIQTHRPEPNMVKPKSDIFGSGQVGLGTFFTRTVDNTIYRKTQACDNVL